MGFNRQTVSRTADAESFSAVINEGNNVCTASITDKQGYKVGSPGVTATTMDKLRAALAKQDPTVKFYARAEGAGTLSAKDAAALEAMRMDVAHTRDMQYRSACRAFGQKPQPRPASNTATVTSSTNRPQGIPALRASAEAWMAFEQAHAELFQPPYGVLNLNAIENWFADEKVQWTADSLAQCYAELKSANCFRTVATLTRGMNGALQIVQPYSRERVLAMRNRQVVTQQTAAPAGMPEADTAAWNSVVQNFPTVPVGSPRFRELCSQTVLEWAKENILSADPSLGAANKRGELRVAIDKQLLAWARPKKQILSTRIWLG